MFDSPGAVKDYLQLQLAAAQHEVFAVLFLDAQHRLIALEELFRGTLTQTSVYPREVVKRALQHHAAAVVLAHNHPSGVAEPSRADESLTQTLKSALALVDVRVLDHVVVGQGRGRVDGRAGTAVTSAAATASGTLAELEPIARRRIARAAPRERRSRRRARARAGRRRQRREHDLFAAPSAPSCRCASARRRPPARARRRRSAPAPARRSRACCANRSPTSSTSRRCSTPTTRCASAAPASAPSRAQAAPRRLGDPGRDRPARPAPRRGARARSPPSCASRPRGPALRARGARQGPRLARPRAGAQGEGAAWLVQRNEVLAFVQARPAEGGHGALVVLLTAGGSQRPRPR